MLAGRLLMSKRNWRYGTRCAPCCVKKPKVSFVDVAKIKYELMEDSSVKRRTGKASLRRFRGKEAEKQIRCQLQKEGTYMTFFVKQMRGNTSEEVRGKGQRELPLG